MRAAGRTDDYSGVYLVLQKDQWRVLPSLAGLDRKMCAMRPDEEARFKELES